MARLHTETIPGSTLAATARVADGFVTTQTDHQGITGPFTRAYTATGITWYTYGWDLTKKAPDGCKWDWTNAQHLPEGRGAEGRLRVNICESARQSPRGPEGGLAKCAAFAPEGRAANGVAARQPRLGRLRQQAVRAIGQTRIVCPEGARSREAAPSQVFGSDGYIKTAYTYTPYGSVTASGSLIQPIQWSSEVWDSELGLVYYNWRYYNAMDGRWLKRDLVHSNNLYTYVKSAPILLFDLLGLDDPPYWSPTANMPINSPSTQSTTPSGKGKTDVTPLPKSDILVFDGKKICIMKYDFSECLACWEAASGRNPDAIDSLSKETQKRKNFGPIPEGKYIVPWTNMEYPDNPEGIWSTKEWNKYAGRWNAFWENMKHDFDISRRSKRKETAWGNYAVRLIAADGTETYGRTHFNIHGGAEKGSAGCIDIGKNDTTFFQKIKTYKDALYLYVDYTGEKSKQCDNCSLYYKNAWSK